MINTRSLDLDSRLDLASHLTSTVDSGLGAPRQRLRHLDSSLDLNSNLDSGLNPDSSVNFDSSLEY
jgi:hypothetical protein